MSVYNLKTNFTSGQLSSNLYGRCDLGIYSNGAKKLENLFIAPTGGVSRRAGFQYVDTLNSAGRLISFEFKFSGAINKTSLDKSNILKKLKTTYSKDKR